MKACWSLLLLTAGLAFATGCVAEVHELRALVTVYPARGEQTPPLARVRSSDLRLEEVDTGRWSYTLVNRQRVFGAVQLALDTTPASYYCEPVQVRVPYASAGPVRVTLHAVQVRDTNDRVREIFATKIGAGGEVRIQALFQLYQEAGYIAKRRLEAIEGGRKFFVYDAQVMFKYLEIARELGRKANLVPSDGVLRVRNFLRTQAGMKEGAAVLKKAIPRGVADVTALVDDIDFVEAEQLRQVWRGIGAMQPKYSDVACERYRAFLATVLEEFDQGLVERWNNHKDYRTVEFPTRALEGCATNLATGPETEASRVRAEETAGVLKAVSERSIVKEGSGLSNTIERSLRALTVTP
jgi:hypothetical protein